MRRFAPAHRHEELLPSPRQRPAAVRPPALALSSIIGNAAMRRMLVAPVVQRSLWDDITGAVDAASEWVSGDTTSAEPSPALEAPASNPNTSDETQQPANDPVSEHEWWPSEAPAQPAEDGGSWFESWFGEQEPEAQSETVPASEAMPESVQEDECAQLEAQIADLSDVIQRLFDESQYLLPLVEAAQAEAEALERTAPGSPQAIEARRRFEQILQHYNAVVDECLRLMELRNDLRRHLEACRASQGSKEKPPPEGFPNS